MERTRYKGRHLQLSILRLHKPSDTRHLQIFDLLTPVNSHALIVRFRLKEKDVATVKQGTASNGTNLLQLTTINLAASDQLTMMKAAASELRLVSINPAVHHNASLATPTANVVASMALGDSTRIRITKIVRRDSVEIVIEDMAAAINAMAVVVKAMAIGAEGIGVVVRAKTGVKSAMVHSSRSVPSPSLTQLRPPQ